MTQSLVQQITAKNEQVNQANQNILAATTVEAKMAAMQARDQLLEELAQAQTRYYEWQHTEAKRLETQARGL